MIFCTPGFVPVCALGVNQMGRLNLGQQVNSLKYFSVCGLQQGYQPFAQNMSKDPPLWMSSGEPLFVKIPEDHAQLQVKRPCWDNLRICEIQFADILVHGLVGFSFINHPLLILQRRIYLQILFNFVWLCIHD